MKLIVEIPTESEVTDEILRRRLLAEIRTDIQLAGFQAEIIGEFQEQYAGLIPYLTGAAK